ncbi:MAG: hypothetical protein J6W65_02540, partial [Oscillospiraceae bacterium]|nr:hypothetical protein [Oscillospiraceae bacterium]
MREYFNLYTCFVFLLLKFRNRHVTIEVYLYRNRFDNDTGEGELVGCKKIRTFWGQQCGRKICAVIL